jgi:hypothetical protein
MKKFIILLVVLISTLAVQLLLVVFGLSIESLVIAIVAGMFLIFYRKKNSYFWIISDLHDQKYLVGIGYYCLSVLIQAYNFFPELFIYNIILFIYIIVILTIPFFFFKKYKFLSFVFLLFGIFVFPLLGLVEFWGMTKIWGIVLLLVVPLFVVSFSSFYEYGDDKIDLEKILYNSTYFVVGFSFIVATISTLIQFWTVEPWYCSSKIVLLVIVFVAIGFGIYFFIRHNKKESCS